jgi:hypothetical protein
MHLLERELEHEVRWKPLQVMLTHMSRERDFAGGDRVDLCQRR